MTSCKIIMHDGTVKNVDYNQAAKVYQILLGNKEPENKEQEEFCMKVQEVVFANGQGKADKPWLTKKFGQKP